MSYQAWNFDKDGKLKRFNNGQETGFDLGLMDEPCVADKFAAGLKTGRYVMFLLPVNNLCQRCKRSSYFAVNACFKGLKLVRSSDGRPG